MSEKGNRIIHLKFNHSNTLLYISTSQGFRIFRLEDSKIISRRDRILSINFMGGFSSILPLYDSQKLALIGTSTNPKFPPFQLSIWDEYQASILHTLTYQSPILKLISRREYIGVIESDSITLISTSNFQLFKSFDTINNPNAVAALNKSGSLILLIPGKASGELQIENLTKSSFMCRKLHENPINCVELNECGTQGVSCSEYGTVIRVFCCESFNILHELRRGTTTAKINCLLFSEDSCYLAAGSNKNTVHVWNLDLLGENQQSWILPSCLQYKRSYCKIRITPDVMWTCEDSQIGPSLCFTEDRYLYVGHLDGNAYCYELSNLDPVQKKVGCFLDFEEEFVEDDCEWTSLE